MRKKSPKITLIRTGNWDFEVDRKLQKIKSLQNEPDWVQESLKGLSVKYKLSYRSIKFPDLQYWLYYDYLFHLLGEYHFDKKKNIFTPIAQMNSNDLTRIKKIESVVDFS